MLTSLLEKTDAVCFQGSQTYSWVRKVTPCQAEESENISEASAREQFTKSVGIEGKV